MRQAGQGRRVNVSIVGQNPLAIQHLVQILKKDPAICLLTPGVKPENQNGLAAAPQVFLFDNCGLALPLSEWMRKLRSINPDAKFIILDQEQSELDVVLSLWSGIHGFVTYSDVARDLRRAIHDVSEGKMWISPEILAYYVQSTSALRGKKSFGVEMTLRERQIVELTKRRLSNREIADALGIHESTVKFHLSNIFSKLQITGRRQLFVKNAASAALPALSPPSTPRAARAGGPEAGSPAPERVYRTVGRS
jgi:DNA-binding NarL/FixJ family response regulator